MVSHGCSAAVLQGSGTRQGGIPRMEGGREGVCSARVRVDYRPLCHVLSGGCLWMCCCVCPAYYHVWCQYSKSNKSDMIMEQLVYVCTIALRRWSGAACSVVGSISM